MSSTNLVQFNELKTKIAELVAPTAQIVVTDFASSQKALEIAKEIKAYQTKVETTRRTLTDPLLAEQKRIKAYADDIKAPLESALESIQKKLSLFAEQQERIRAEEHRKAEEIRIKSEREARAKAQREAEELAAKQEAERALEAEAPLAFGSEVAEESVDARHAREAFELQAKIEQEAAIRTAQARQEAWDIDQHRIKGTRKNYFCKIENLALIPKEFLVVTLNEKAAIAAHKAGVQIPGVAFWSEASVTIGTKTYVPRAVIEKEKAEA